MLKKVYTVLSLLFILGIMFPAYAITYYVDFANGNDYNNGLTTTTAFKHSPGDPLATGSAGSTTLQAGDVVQFKAGVAYKGQVLLTRSGNSSNAIEYRGQGWGTGRSTFNMENTRQYAFKGGVDYIKITGFNLYHYAKTGTDYVIYPTSGASHWTIDNVSIAYIKDWNSVSVFPDKPCILLSNSISNITIKNSEFFASGRTIMRLRAVSYVTIKNNDFGGINRGSQKGWFSVAIRGELSCNNIHIIENKFHDGWQYGGDQVPELNHAPAFIHLYGLNSTTHPNQIYIERNYFYNDKVFSTGTGTGSLEITTQVKNVFIRNNIFANACQYWGTQLLLSDGCDNINIYNNTFIDRAYVTGYGVNSIKIYLNSGIVGNNINIKNNIFWNDANESGDDCVYFHGNGTFQGTIDHNAYFRSNSSHVNVFNDAVVSWSTWQNHGLDLHSHYYGLTAPAFVSMPSSGAMTSSGDYSLNPNAANLIDKGVTLTGFSDSYNGVTRPQGAAWDLGACEFGGPSSDTIPPKVMGASINNATTVVVNFSEALDQTSAEVASNYTINNGIIVTGAALSSDGQNVTLTTSPYSSGQSYVVTVNNVTDLAGNIISPTANTAEHNFFSDTTPPKLAGAELSEKTELFVTFSEEMDQASIENKDNYSIDNEITVLNAEALPGNARVLLTISNQSTSTKYTLTVNNVKDVARNIIDPLNNKFIYWLRNNIKYPVLGANAQWYQNYIPKKAIDGNTDTSSEARWGGVLKMPDSIVFDLGKIYTIDETHFSFYRWDKGRTYNYSVMISSDGTNWANVVINQISFLKEWTIDGFSPVKGRYVKLTVLSSNESEFASLWEAEIWGPDNIMGVVEDGIQSPSEFKLEQNYPNPFNPTTTIKFNIPSDQQVKIDVYNTLGQVVKTLVNQFYTSGSYTVSFDASDLASGVYIYSLEAGAFKASKKMVLMK